MVHMGGSNDESKVFRHLGGNEHLCGAERWPDCPRTVQSPRGAKGRPGKCFDTGSGAALPALQCSALVTFPAEPAEAQ